jgi:hypothetical protein
MRTVLATAVGLVACPVIGWAAHGATLAIAPFQSGVLVEGRRDSS